MKHLGRGGIGLGAVEQDGDRLGAPLVDLTGSGGGQPGADDGISTWITSSTEWAAVHDGVAQHLRRADDHHEQLA
jgi:hypothetical protein